MDEALIVEAGEFVLGTLDAAERRAFVIRLAREPEAAAAVAMWRVQLAPLAGCAGEVTPPDSVWPRIEARIAEGDVPVAANDNRVASWWREAAVVASVIAVVLGGLAMRPAPVVTPVPPPVQVAAAPGPSYVAAVAEAGSEPALLVTLDPKTGRAVVRALGLTPPAKRSLELWYIGGGRGPQSLGLVAGNAAIERRLVEALKANDRFDDAQFAVSVEPEGGSPGDAPTGEIIYSGKLVRVDPTS